jgi:phosphoserine phosphatase
MTHVATIIAPHGIGGAALEKARAALASASTPVWLADGIAADVPFTPESQIDQRALAARLKTRLGGSLDVVVQPAARRRKRLFLADMDSTMIEQECIDELAAYVGLKEHVAAITERAMRGEIAFEPALRERVALLKGLSVSVVDEVLKKHITLTPGGRTLVKTMRAHGAHTCLVSGGFTLFTNRVAAMIGFDETHANKLTLDGEHLGGAVEEPIFGRASKLQSLRSLRARLGLAREETLVAGDGANDLDMILDAGLGVAYHAKPKVAEAAAARIDHADLSALLYAQGYRREEFFSD